MNDLGCSRRVRDSARRNVSPSGEAGLWAGDEACDCGLLEKRPGGHFGPGSYPRLPHPPAKWLK